MEKEQKYLNFWGTKDNIHYDCDMNLLEKAQEFQNKSIYIDDELRLIIKQDVDFGFKSMKNNKSIDSFNDIINNLSILEVLEQLRQNINAIPRFNTEFDRDCLEFNNDVQLKHLKLNNIILDVDEEVKSIEFVVKYFTSTSNTDSEYQIVRNCIFNLIKDDDYTLALFERVMNESKNVIKDWANIKFNKKRTTEDLKFEYNVLIFTLYF